MPLSILKLAEQLEQTFQIHCRLIICLVLNTRKILLTSNFALFNIDTTKSELLFITLNTLGFFVKGLKVKGCN